MKMKYVKYGVLAVLGVGAFVVISQVAQTYSETLQQITEQTGVYGILSYISIMALSIVVAPIGTGFLLPIAANSWGPLVAAVYSITGWTVGSVVAFWLAKKYGLRLVKNIDTVKRLRDIEQAIPKRHIFLIVVLLRMALPVDLLSYALGIFSSMRYWSFFWSTIIGITPFAIIFMYASVSTVTVQVVVAVIASVIMFAGGYYVYTYSKLNKNKEEVE